MNFSLLLNSRGRPQLLLQLLESIEKNTKDLSNIEVLIRFDDDDNTIPELNYEWVQTFRGKRTKKLVNNLNDLYFHSNGHYIWVLNDDCVIQTEGWDEIAKSYLDVYKDNIVYGAVQDDSCDKESHRGYASFPIIGENGAKSLHYVMDPAYNSLGSDVVLYRVYNSIDRVVTLPISVSHVLHTSIDKVINPDVTCAEMRNTANHIEINPWYYDVSKDVEILNEEISSNL